MGRDRHPIPPPEPPPALRRPDVGLPAYRYVPGLQPHPHKGRGGHGHAPELDRDALWQHGLDLFDHRFYWECHEVLEGRWKTLPRGDAERERLQGLIQAAAAALQQHLGHPAGARRLLDRATARFDAARPAEGDVVGGCSTAGVVAAVEAFLSGGAWPRTR